MLIAGLLLAGLAALFHVYVFYLESIAWTRDRTRATFGTTAKEAQVTKPLAFNQGFYNLFLALMVVTGLAAFLSAPVVGATLVFAGAGSMVAAGLVLLLSNRELARAALAQLLPPLLAVILLAVGLLT